MRAFLLSLFSCFDITWVLHVQYTDCSIFLLLTGCRRVLVITSGLMFLPLLYSWGNEGLALLAIFLCVLENDDSYNGIHHPASENDFPQVSHRIYLWFDSACIRWMIKQYKSNKSIGNCLRKKKACTLLIKKIVRYMQHSILQTNIQQSSATTEMLPESERFQRRYLAVLTTEELQETEHKMAEHDEIY